MSKDAYIINLEWFQDIDRCSKGEEITLNENHYLASGVRRDCYCHPFEDDLCIKIPKNKDGIKDCAREIYYMRQIEKRLNLQEYYYSQFVCTVETNKGLGYVYKLIRDTPSLQVSQTLEKVYIDAILANKSELKAALDQKISALKETLQKDKMLVSDLSPRNIAVQYLSEDTFKLVLIDGMGRSNFLPFLDRLGWVSNKKVNAYFEKKLGNAITHFNDVYRYLTMSS